MNISEGRQFRSKAAGKCLAAAFFVTANFAIAQTVDSESPISSMSPLERSEIEVRANDKINSMLRGRTFFPGQASPVIASSRLDPETNELLVDLGEENGPYAESLEMEDLQKHITEAASQVLGSIDGWEGVDLRFGGKDMYFWFPQQRPAEDLVRPAAATDDAKASSTDTIVLSAGHGVYYHEGYKKWMPQREVYFSAREDDVTQDFVAQLNQQMIRELWGRKRQKLEVVLARSLSSDIHEESGRPWRDIAGRYHIKALYPDIPELWHSRPHNQGGDNERIEDMYSRPALANHVNAAASIHIHTNAWEPETRGARFYYQKGQPESKRLASSLACHVREVLKSRPEFPDYVVDAVGRTGNYAELRSAKMPSSLIEIGFHTNEKDAAAMQRPDFRKFAMAGVRKGYELFRAGVACDPFKVTDVTNISTFGSTISLQATYSGTPTFPVYLELGDEFGNVTYAQASGPTAPNLLTFDIQCRRRRAQVKFVGYFDDDDYVLTKKPFTADCWGWMGW